MVSEGVHLRKEEHMKATTKIKAKAAIVKGKAKVKIAKAKISAKTAMAKAKLKAKAAKAKMSMKGKRLGSDFMSGGFAG